VNEPVMSPLNSKAAFGLRSFVVRVAIIAAVLAVPIIAASCVLVGQVTSNMSMAAGERTTLANVAGVTRLFTLAQQLRERATESDARAQFATVGEVLQQTRRGYDGVAHSEQTAAYWHLLNGRWDAAQRSRRATSITAFIDLLSDSDSQVDGDNPLDLDPESAVQYLSDVILRREPRLLATLQETADAAARADNRRLALRAGEQIAWHRALEDRARRDAFENTQLAMSLDPSVERQLRTRVADAAAATAAYERRVDTLMALGTFSPADGRTIAKLAVAAIDADEQLWRDAQAAAGRLVDARYDHERQRRRVVIALASCAIVLGALGVTLVGRYEARRDRIELAAAKLEGDRLRAEVSRLSVMRALRLQEAQFRAIFVSAELGIAIFDPSGEVLQYNAAADAILQTKTQQFLASVRATVLQLSTANSRSVTVDHFRIDDAQSQQWLSLTFSGVYDEGACQMVILLIRDATEERLLAVKLLHDASHDSLTQLVNRAAMDRELHDVVALGHAEQPFSLMYIDLDNFKPINDSHGHQVGDHVLITVAERLRSVVGPQDVCARLGGDEFAILLRGVNDVQTIRSIAQRVVSNIALPIAYVDGIEMRVTASVGVARSSDDACSIDQLKHRADVALYEVKRRSRNGFSIFAEDQHAVDSRSG
jgi:diguanylate cyclase (GGDEF)-like protein